MRNDTKNYQNCMISHQLRVISKNKAELKEQFRIQEHRLTRNNIRVNSTEDENETWENTENKLRFFLHYELETTDELYRESTPY